MATTRPASSTRKPAASRAKGPVQLDLDTLEREREPRPPYVVTVGGDRITFRDVVELDWQIAASLSADRPYQFFEAVVLEADQETFLSKSFPLWKMGKLIKNYREYYEIDDEGNSVG